MKVSSHSGRWTNGLGQDWGKVRRAASCQSRKKCCLCLKFSSLWNFCTNFDFLKNPLKYYISSLLRFSVSLNFAPMANASLTSPWSWPVTPWLRDGLWPQTEVSFNPSLPLTRSMTRAKLRDLSKPNILAWKVEIKLLIGYFYLFLLLFFFYFLYLLWELNAYFILTGHLALLVATILDAQTQTFFLEDQGRQEPQK